MLSSSVMIVLLGLSAPAAPPDMSDLQLDRPRFRIEIPTIVLSDVPVKRILITALDEDGNLDSTFNGRPLILGIRLTVPAEVTKKRALPALPGLEEETRTIRFRIDTELPAFEKGVLELTTDLAEGRKVYITASKIVVDPESRFRGEVDVYRTLRWFSLVPPMLAIVIALWLKNVVAALFVAVWSGAVILAQGNFFNGFLRTLDTYLLGELVQPGFTDHPHMMIILFTMFMGAMVGVMARGGGTTALVQSLAGFTTTRERGQLMTWALGLMIFFDDYANTLLVGSTMRPVTDRLKISREKLAFLVDSTAAPVAGLAIISTWVGVEIGYISDMYSRLGMSGDAYGTFLASIPYRFYSLHLLVFVWLIAYSGYDFGPMLKAEARALGKGELNKPGADVPEFEDFTDIPATRTLLRNAIIPLVTLLGLMLMGLWWTGSSALAMENFVRLENDLKPLPETFYNFLAHASANRVLFLSSFVASVVAVMSVTFTRSLTLHESIEAWSHGAKSMLNAAMILVLAWSVASICDENHLNTAGFLVELSHGRLGVRWMPSLVFLLAAAVSFATGSSWSTMGLLMPLSISLTYYLLLDVNEAAPNHHLMLATIGAVLAGSLFGDHCSPISDTTVLSSAASGSDHFDHVATQLPYALSVALVSLLFGYFPVGFGYSPIVLLPLGLVVLFMLVIFLGRPVDKAAELWYPPDEEDQPKRKSKDDKNRPGGDVPPEPPAETDAGEQKTEPDKK